MILAELSTVSPDVDVDWDSWLDVSSDIVHVECCARRAFLCGAEYHPESGTLDPSDDACEDCLHVIDGGRCPPSRPTHFHCPLGLPLFCEGPKLRK